MCIGKIIDMTPLAGILRRSQDSPMEGQALSTGLRDLDTSTGALGIGHVWIVIGFPGQGRTTLAAQWALLAATAKWPTTLVCPREPVRAVAHRLLSNKGKVPLLDLQRTGTSDTIRLEQARATLAELPMTIVAEGDRSWLSLVDGEDDLVPGSVLIVDDADLTPGVSPERGRSIADRGALVIVTLPRHLLMYTDRDHQWLDPAWSRVADVVIEIRQAAWPDDQQTLRPGEADLIVLKNRWGPTGRVSVIFEGHYARFIDLAT